MAERRLIDEISGDTFRVSVNPAMGTWSVQRVRDAASCEGEFRGTFDAGLKFSSRVVELGEGLSLQYGIFATRDDYAAGYMLRMRTELASADLFLTAKVLAWLTSDPEAERRRLQETRPSYRYAAHVAHLVPVIA